LWHDIERRVRDVVSARQQPVFIIAGPLFIVPEGNPDFEFNTIGDGQISVPTHFFRIVAIANEYQGVDAFGLIAPNDEDGEELDLNSYIVPISEIEKISGLKFFPFLDPQLAAIIKNNLEPLW